jgi:capsular polysaccharide transport system permease protein
MADDSRTTDMLSTAAAVSQGRARQVSTGLRPQALRRRLLLVSFVLCVLVPSFFGGLYFAFVASDRYVSGAGFAIRGIDANGGTELLGAMAGLASSGTTTSDSYIVLKYMKSRDLVESVDRDVSLRKVYAREDADLLSRLNPALEIERIVQYWDGRVDVAFDGVSGIVSFEVEAFTPEDAQAVAVSVLSHTQALTNELSRQARKDTVSFAESEAQRAEQRLADALAALRIFRDRQNAIDPAGTARIELDLVGGLQRQLAEVEARIAALDDAVDSRSPSLRNLNRQAEALRTQIQERRRAIGIADPAGGRTETALTGQLAEYEALEVERSFAQQAYASALSSLETARVDASRQQRYLAVYTAPALPQYPLYPRRILNGVLIFLGLALSWGIGVLVIYAVRDHIA